MYVLSCLGLSCHLFLSGLPCLDVFVLSLEMMHCPYDPHISPCLPIFNTLPVCLFTRWSESLTQVAIPLYAETGNVTKQLKLLFDEANILESKVSESKIKVRLLSNFPKIGRLSCVLLLRTLNRNSPAVCQRFPTPSRPLPNHPGSSLCVLGNMPCFASSICLRVIQPVSCIKQYIARSH